ncbi:Hopanoid C-3 methylase [Myxococcaceae bacterium]|nr:Hopanoid C-3 methylase [Myxococcaceae bacterium]
MRVFFVHPSPLMYSKVFLRLEPIGLELVAASARERGHEVRLLDLQAAGHDAYHRILDEWRPDVIAFGLNYLANVPEVIDLSKETKAKLPKCFFAVGGHSASFTARELLEHAEGAVDVVLRGEGEASMPLLLDAVEGDRDAIAKVPGAVTLDGEGPAPVFIESLDDLFPARDLLPNRRSYFLGVLDPCASIEFSRGCPWDCSFCSAWTFYGRSYRLASAEKAGEELSRIQEKGVFIVDDVAFLQEKHGFAIGAEIERRNIKKEFYLETRGDVLLRNKQVFEYWKTLGLSYMFLGLEAIDAESLKKLRKRVSLDRNMEAMEFARSLGIAVAVNIIADPDWDESRFQTVRDWALSIPEIVNVSINTPYPGTETWETESRRLMTRDYRLFDIQHAVLPTRLPLPRFYEELVKTQQILNMKHMGFGALKDTSILAMKRLLAGQTNFVKMLWKFSSVYDPKLQLADHAQPVRYEMRARERHGETRFNARKLYVHDKVSKVRQTDADTEAFVAETGGRSEAEVAPAAS